MNYLFRNDLIGAPNENIPAAIPSLIEAARPSASRGGLLAWQLNRVIDYIETHLAEKIMAMDLADLINVSVGRLIRAFKISVGVPPFRYIANRRVELACTMMSTTREPLSQIAIACGLCDQAHLCKVFRRMIGMSPSTWRRTIPVRDTAKFKIIDLTAHAPTHQRQNSYAAGNKFI